MAVESYLILNLFTSSTIVYDLETERTAIMLYEARNGIL